MLDPLFPFVDRIVEPIEDEANLFHFIAQVEALFEHPEQFQAEYQKLKASAGLPLSEEGQKAYGAMTALKRMGDPAEIAAAAAFLASSDSSFMTGSEVAVDGGLAQL